MFWNKSKKKSPEEEDLEVISKLIFPGGAQEKLFRAQKVIELCNGKLPFDVALHVYTKAKVRFTFATLRYDGKVHLGITADELIQRTKDDSGGKLSFLESVAVNAYVVFDKVEPALNSHVSLKHFLTNAFGADDQGYDCDVIPFAIGEYGLEATNPIPIRGIGGVAVYLMSLRSEDGKNVSCKRIRAIVGTDKSQRIDEYDA